MNRLLIIFLTLTLLIWAVPASAIKVEGEKIEKKDDASKDAKPADNQSGDKASEATPASDQSDTAPAPKSGGNLLDKLRRSVVEQKKDETPKYDQFKDANNDGVDDQASKSNPDEGNKPNAAVKVAEPELKETPKPQPSSTQTLKKKGAPEATTTKKKKP